MFALMCGIAQPIKSWMTAVPLVFGSLYRMTDNIALQIGCAKNMLVKVLNATIEHPDCNVLGCQARSSCGFHIV